jgi:hypothetical protein
MRRGMHKTGEGGGGRVAYVYKSLYTGHFIQSFAHTLLSTGTEETLCVIVISACHSQLACKIDYAYDHLVTYSWLLLVLVPVSFRVGARRPLLFKALLDEWRTGLHI